MKTPSWIQKIVDWWKRKTTAPKAAEKPSPEKPADPSSSPSLTPYVLNRQHLFCGMVAYHWSGLDADLICSLIRSKTACTGLELELMELIQSGDMIEQQAAQIAKLKPWAAACRKYGLWLYVSVINSNDPLNKGKGFEVFKARIDGLRAALGTDRILVQPMSEDDDNMDKGVRDLVRAYASTVWPKAQLVEMKGKSHGGAFVESHLQHLTDFGLGLPANWQSLIVSDSGPVLADRIPADSVVWMAQRHLDAGYSFSIYGFGSTLDVSTLARVKMPGATNSGRTTTVLQADAPEVIGALGWEDGHTLPALDKIKIAYRLDKASVNGKTASFSPANPFGDGAWLCLAWFEEGRVYWCTVEGLHADMTRQNYGDNLFPDKKRGPGRCRDNAGVAHYPRTGARVWVALMNKSRNERSNFVDAGTQ